MSLSKEGKRLGTVLLVGQGGAWAGPGSGFSNFPQLSLPGTWLLLRGGNCGPGGTEDGSW